MGGVIAGRSPAHVQENVPHLRCRRASTAGIADRLVIVIAEIFLLAIANVLRLDAVGCLRQSHRVQFAQASCQVGLAPEIKDVNQRPLLD